MNFFEWYEQVQFYLDVMDLDLAMLNYKPTTITDTSIEYEKYFHKAWEDSKKLSLMFTLMTIANHIKSTIPYIG